MLWLLTSRMRFSTLACPFDNETAMYRMGPLPSPSARHTVLAYQPFPLYTDAQAPATT